MHNKRMQCDCWIIRVPNPTVSRRICCRCGTSFSISQTGKHTRKEECNYHYGKVLENRGEKWIKWITAFTRHIWYIVTARQISGDTLLPFSPTNPNMPQYYEERCFFLAWPLQYGLHNHLNLNQSRCSEKNWQESFERFSQTSAHHETFRKVRGTQPFKC